MCARLVRRHDGGKRGLLRPLLFSWSVTCGKMGLGVLSGLPGTLHHPYVPNPFPANQPTHPLHPLVVAEEGAEITFDGFPWVLRLRYVMENANSIAEAKALWEATNNTVGFNFGVGSASDAKNGGHAFLAMETNMDLTGMCEEKKGWWVCAPLVLYLLPGHLPTTTHIHTLTHAPVVPPTPTPPPF